MGKRKLQQVPSVNPMQQPAQCMAGPTAPVARPQPVVWTGPLQQGSSDRCEGLEVGTINGKRVMMQFGRLNTGSRPVTPQLQQQNPAVLVEQCLLTHVWCAAAAAGTQDFVQQGPGMSIFPEPRCQQDF